MFYVTNSILQAGSLVIKNVLCISKGIYIPYLCSMNKKKTYSAVKWNRIRNLLLVGHNSSTLVASFLPFFSSFQSHHLPLSLSLSPIYRTYPTQNPPIPPPPQISILLPYTYTPKLLHCTIARQTSLIGPSPPYSQKCAPSPAPATQHRVCCNYCGVGKRAGLGGTQTEESHQLLPLSVSVQLTSDSCAALVMLHCSCCLVKFSVCMYVQWRGEISIFPFISLSFVFGGGAELAVCAKWWVLVVIHGVLGVQSFVPGWPLRKVHSGVSFKKAHLVFLGQLLKIFEQENPKSEKWQQKQ